MVLTAQGNFVEAIYEGGIIYGKFKVGSFDYVAKKRYEFHVYAILNEYWLKKLTANMAYRQVIVMENVYPLVHSQGLKLGDGASVTLLGRLVHVL